MIEILLPSGIIASLFFVFWVASYPQIIFESMIFKDTPFLVSIGAWLFFLLFVGTIKFAASLAT